MTDGFSQRLEESRVSGQRLYTAATPLIVPDTWLSSFSVTWIGVPRRAMFELKVRRKCRSNPTFPLNS